MSWGFNGQNYMQSSPCLLSISASPWSVWIHIYSQPCAFNFFCGLIKAIWERGILIGWFLFFLFKNLWTAECECLTVTNAALAGSHFFQPASERTDSLSWRKCEEKTNCTHTHTYNHTQTQNLDSIIQTALLRWEAEHT